MILHLINGFLGSGKTTAIIAATRILMQQGKTVGIVTNDKGRFQVDTAFFQSFHIPTRQVTGGCFRCSFSEFEDTIAQLQADSAPQVIFAESVGSCVDLVNTIFGPIQQNSSLKVEKSTYSVFCDIRLFRRWIQDEPLPFSDKINYLFVKQIEESKILVLNKADLINPDQLNEILAYAQQSFPDKKILLQNSLEPAGVLPWLDALEKEANLHDQPGFKVDYPTYKGGEAEMAWLDHNIRIFAETPQQARLALIEIVNHILAVLQGRQVMVGHLKLFLTSPGEGVKVSFTTADFLERSISPGWVDQVPEIEAKPLEVMLNARLSLDAAAFAEIVKNAIDSAEKAVRVNIEQEKGSAYNPDMSMRRPGDKLGAT